jgi:DNA-binding NtrC family response regulator
MDPGIAHRLQKTILVVEDNELNRRLLEVRLEIHGYASLTTSRGAAALNMAREREPDLILMDIQLPDISGAGLYSSSEGNSVVGWHPKRDLELAYIAFELGSAAHGDTGLHKRRLAQGHQKEAWGRVRGARAR